MRVEGVGVPDQASSAEQRERRTFRRGYWLFLGWPLAAAIALFVFLLITSH